MKISTKYFFSGIAAAVLVFLAFAFTTKQNNISKYLTIRVVEGNAKYVNQMIQVTNEKGELEILRNVIIRGSYGLDVKGNNTKNINDLLNEYAAKGYHLASTSVAALNHENNKSKTLNGKGEKLLITTLILER
jgi:hypothetical protein